MFSAPTYAGEPMRFEAILLAEEGERATIHLRVTRIADSVITCQGKTVLRRAQPEDPE